MNKIPESTTLLYSELQQQCVAILPVDKGISYSTKTVNGHKYWYLELTVGNRTKAMSLGPDSKELLQQIEAQKVLVKQSKESVANRQRLVAMLAKGGAACPSTTEARVLEVLERAGIFLAGGVAVGSNAFGVYGNMLGVQWPGAMMKTQDMDIAGASHIPVAVTRSDKPIVDVLKESGMSFFAVPALNPKAPSTMYRLYNQEFRIDLITPMLGATSSHPVFLKNLKTFAEPLRFLDYLLEDALPAVVLAKAGIMVNVPDPARFALHKLVVSIRRLAHQHLKAEKDRIQAELLLTVLFESRPGNVLLAMDAAKKMPNKFIQQLREGLSYLNDDIKDACLALLDSDN